MVATMARRQGVLLPAAERRRNGAAASAAAAVAPAEDGAGEQTDADADAGRDEGEYDHLHGPHLALGLRVEEYREHHRLGHRHVPEDLADLWVGEGGGVRVHWVEEGSDRVLGTEAVEDPLEEADGPLLRPLGGGDLDAAGVGALELEVRRELLAQAVGM